MTVRETDRRTTGPAGAGRGVFVRALLRDPVTLTAWAVVVLIALAAVVGPLVYPHDPFFQYPDSRLLPPGSESVDPALPAHLLGTDPLGRDVGARLLQGARISLTIGIAGVVLAGLIGITVGVVAGYARGRVEDLLMRVTDIQISFPTLVLALFVMFTLGSGIVNLLLAMAISTWPVYARVARSLTLSVSAELYVESARTLGASPVRILREHVWPNIRSPLGILATLEVAKMIMFEASLSFLGLGVQPPGTSWGLMISVGRDYLTSGWWMIWFPGLLIFVTCLSLNLIAGWMQNLSDPVRRTQWVQRGIPAGDRG